jgi:hypothetical protein
VVPESRTPLLHDPNGSGVIGRQGSESIDDKDGRAEVRLEFASSTANFHLPSRLQVLQFVSCR